MFVIAAKRRRTALLSACAAGGYFFRFAGKSNQKGATSLEEAIFFLYGNCGAAMETLPFPATYCGGLGECLRCAARRGEACRGVGDSGKALAYRKLLSGANRKDYVAAIAAAHCAAMRCVSCRGKVVVTASANLRFKALPRYYNNHRRGRRPQRPLFGLPQTLASEHYTLLCGCVGCPRLPPRFARRDTHLLAAPHSAGRGAGWLRQILVATHRHLPLANRAKARQFGDSVRVRTYGHVHLQLRNPPKPKSGFFGSFLAKTRKEPPAAQALSSEARRSFALLTNIAPAANSCTHLHQTTSSPERKTAYRPPRTKTRKKPPAAQA
ncbi:MAG: hypothetical protein LBO63_00840 [Oscillospiraceae bacterium]|nr:hypothetical protein [Oscillospiraceae bacterium]